MDKKIFIKNRPFDVNDANDMQNWTENGLKNTMSAIYSSGIVDGLNVSVNSGMRLNISSGRAFDSNYDFINISSVQNLTISASQTNPRIDKIVVKYKSNTVDNYDTSNVYGFGTSFIYSRNKVDSFELSIVKGTAAASPVAPATPNDSLALAQVLVPANASSIGAANITDLREYISINENINKPEIHISNANPEDVNVLFIDTRDGLAKYHNGTTWVSTNAKNADTVDNKHFTDIQADAQNKADAAKQAAIEWAKSFGFGSVMKLADDWNLISESGFYAGENNSPVAGSTYYGIHLERTNTHAIQIVSRVGKTYTRSKENGIWQDWVLLETSIGAQAKADAAKSAAETAAINWAKSFGLGDVSKDISNTNLNSLDATGFYRGSYLANSPESNEWFWIINLKHTSSHKSQIAIRAGIKSTRIFHRNMNSGAWSNWTSLNNNHRIKLTSSTDLYNLIPGQYYITGTSMINGPVTGDNSWFNIDVDGTEESAGSSEQMKQIKVSRNFDNRVWIGNIHTNGNFSGWKELESVADSQAKADAAKNAAINWAKDYGLGTISKNIGTVNLNNLPNENGFYTVNSDSTNLPVNNLQFYIINISGAQIAISNSVNVKMYFRRYSSSNGWTNWIENETVDGAQAKVDIIKNRKINAGNGLSGGGSLEADRTLTLGTPGTLNGSSTNNVTSTSHTHSLDMASTAESEAGTNSSKLMTPKTVKEAITKFAQTPPITSNTGGTKIAVSSPTSDLYQELQNLGNGLHTYYCHTDVKNSPGITARGFYHQTSVGFGWVYAHSFDNRVFINYVNDNNWRGWKELSSTDDLLREIGKTQMSKITDDNGNAYVRYTNVNLLDEIVKTTTPNFMTYYASGSDVTGLPTPHSVRGIKVFSENTYGYTMVVNYYNEMYINYYAGNYWTGWSKIGGGSVYVEAGSTANRNLTQGAVNKLTYNNEIVDNRGCYTPASSRFTAPYDALYHVELSAFFHAVTSYQNFELKIFKNGNEYMNIGTNRWKPHENNTNVAFEQIVRGTSIISLKAGDYIEPYVYVGATTVYDGFRFDHKEFRFNHFKIIEMGGQHYGS